MFSWFARNRMEKNGGDEKAATFAGSQYGAITTRNEAAATEEMRQGMALLRDAAARAGNRAVDKTQGNLLEYIETAKFNSEAARQGASFRQRITEAIGRPHDPADAETFDLATGQVLQKVQYKSAGDGKGSIARQVRNVSDPKYKGMQRVVNKNHFDQVQDRLDKAAARKGNVFSQDYNDAQANLSKGTSYDSVKTTGTTYNETTQAATRPRTYAAMMEVKQGLTEAGITAGQASAGGLVVGGAISAVKNSIAVYNGEMTAGDAVRVTTKEAGKSGLRAGAAGGIGSLIRQGAAKAGVKSLAKSNVATAVASAVIDTGVVVYDLVKGEITAQDAVIRMGQNTTSTISGLYAGAAAGAVFGPAGAVIGSIAGFMISSNVYQSCVAIFENARLSEVEAARVIALCEEAVEEMKKQRKEFETYVKDVLAERHSEFSRCFALIDKGLLFDSPEITTYALAELADVIGAQLKLATFEEFDDFMMKSNEPLKL